MNKEMYSKPTVLSRVVKVVWAVYLANFLVLVVVPCNIGSRLQPSAFGGTSLNSDQFSVSNLPALQLQLIQFYSIYISVLQIILQFIQLQFQVSLYSVCRNFLQSILNILQLQQQQVQVTDIWKLKFIIILLIIQILKMLPLFFWLHIQFLKIWQSTDHTRCISNICARFIHHDECWGFTPAGEWFKVISTRVIRLLNFYTATGCLLNRCLQVFSQACAAHAL